MAVDKNRKKALDAEITDALLDDFDKFEHFAATYWKQIGIVAVLIIAAVAGWVMASKARKASARKINDEICNAETEAEILETVQKYPDYPASNYARLRLAKMFLKQKRYEKAYEQFKLLRNSSIPREMTWRLSLDEAYAMELENKKAAAAAQFAQLGNSPSLPDEYRCEANYSAGRIYAELKRREDAVKYLGRAGRIKPGMNKQTTFLWTSQAKFLLIRLDKKAPKTPLKKEAAKKAPVRKTVAPAPKTPAKK